MVLFIVAPVLIGVALYYTTHPSKHDPLYPERKRRDWWLIGGLFGGGILGYYVSKVVTNVLLQVVPQLRVVGLFVKVEMPQSLLNVMCARNHIIAWLRGPIWAWPCSSGGRQRTRSCCVPDGSARSDP